MKIEEKLIQEGYILGPRGVVYTKSGFSLGRIDIFSEKQIHIQYDIEKEGPGENVFKINLGQILEAIKLREFAKENNLTYIELNKEHTKKYLKILVNKIPEIIKKVED